MSTAAIAASCLLSFLAPFPLSAQPASDSFEMRVIATLPYWPVRRVTCGDADHDGKQEYYAVGFRGEWCDYILEHRGSNEFDTTCLGCTLGMNWAIGDADRDGKTDLVVEDCRFTGQFLCVYESPDSFSLPETLVWEMTIPGQGNGMYAAITDLDVDSLYEITLMDFQDWCIRIYENAGDDRYEPIAQLTAEWYPVQTYDMDCDGTPELLHSAYWGGVGFYEAVCNDSFVLVANCTLPDLHEERALAAAPDMDRDGKPEAIVLGIHRDGEATLAVFESPGNDSFEAVWVTRFFGNYWVWQAIAVGDVDGDSVLEFAVTDGINVRLFRCTGNDQYEQFWQTETYEEEVGLYDINSDGRAEVICRINNTTVIYEYFPLGIEERRLRQLEQVFVSPAIVAGGEAVRISGLGVGAKVEVVDACGRVVAALVERRNGEAVWSTGSVQPGAYFIRASLGTQSVTRKVVVLR